MTEFTRERILPFNTLIIFILQKANSSLQVCLDDFFDIQSLQAPTKSAFTQARKKLSHLVFERLNSMIVDIFYKHAPFKKWKGFRVLGVDGSTLQLPDHKSLVDKFSHHLFGPKADSGHWMSRISYLYDVFNGLVIDAQMESYRTSEASLCQAHLPFVKMGDLVLFDRYYASFLLMFQLVHNEAHFIFRMKENWWICVDAFVKSGLKEQIITLPLSAKLKIQHLHLKEEMQVRLIRKTNRKGEVQVFCTSLTDCQTYSHQAIINLYKQRWGIEEAYKLIKARLEVADFSGKTAWAVQQDFYAKTMLLSLCNALSVDIKPNPVRKPLSKSQDRIPIINRTYALNKLKKMIGQILTEKPIEDLINRFVEKVASVTEYSRCGQHFERNFKPNLKDSMSYKGS